MKKQIFSLAAFFLALVLTGCSGARLYRLPQRPQTQRQLQQAQEAAMAGKEYAAASRGSASERLLCRDLDADGTQELVILARQEGALQVITLAAGTQGYAVAQTLTCPGHAFGRADWLGDGELLLWLADPDGIVTHIQRLSYGDGGFQVSSSREAQQVSYELALYRIRHSKGYTFAHYEEGWLLSLQGSWAENLEPMKSLAGYEFYLPQEDLRQKIFTLYTFTGADREERAVLENRFVLTRTSSAVYAAHLQVASGRFSLTQEHLKSGFILL